MRAAKATKKSKKKVPSRKQEEDAKHSSDDYAEEDSNDGVHKGNRKEEIDIMGEDTIPYKKNNKQMAAAASEQSMEFDERKAKLNRSGLSQNQLDRSSVRSGISRKRKEQTIEEYVGS